MTERNEWSVLLAALLSLLLFAAPAVSGDDDEEETFDVAEIFFERQRPFDLSKLVNAAKKAR